MSDEKKKQMLTITAMTPAADGFDTFDNRDSIDDTGDAPVGGGIIQGSLVKFTNQATWVLRDGVEMPDIELIAANVLRIVQKWVDQTPVETHILEPGEKPNIEARNNAAPKSEWRESFGKMVGPWQFQYIVYLLNPETMDKYTFPTGTDGGAKAVRDLAERIQNMRKFRGAHVHPVVKLADTFFPTRYGGRQRPNFLIVKWVQLGGEAALPEPEKPKPVPPSAQATVAEPAKSDLKVISEPGLSEQMNDTLDDILNAPAAPKKPAAPSQKPAMTKKGVQKIASGRR